MPATNGSVPSRTARATARPSSPSRRAALRVLLAAACAAAALSFTSTGNAADRGAVNPLTRHYASLQVGPGHEFRLLTIHPLFASTLAEKPEDLRAAGDANPVTLGFRAPSGGRTLPLRIDNLIDERLVVFPGEIVRSDRYDLAFTDHVAVKGKSGTDGPLAVVSQAAPPDESRPERRILPAWLPPTLRWAIGPEAPERDLPDTVAEWQKDAGLENGRRSLADLARGTAIRERVGDYVRALGTLSRAPAGLQTVGYAALVDGTPVIVETFADGGLFTGAWPRLVEALAVEASIHEVREELLDQEIPPTGQPDRFLAPVRALILTFYERPPESRRARETGEILEVATPRGILHGLVIDKDTFVHAYLVTDPRRRGLDGEDDFDPGVISRKARPTEAEKRWLDRRKDRNPPIPKPPELPPEQK